MFQHYVVLGVGNTVANCIKYCKEQKYIYAGVQHYDWCFCGNQFPKLPHFPKLNIFKCNTPCRGDDSKMCGGVWANNVYETGNKGKKLISKILLLH